MNEDAHVDITLSRKPFRVPVVEDEATTKRLADEFNARIDAVESRQKRTDSFEAALLAGMELVVELEQTKRQLAELRAQYQRESENDDATLLEALGEIGDRVQGLLDTIRFPGQGHRSSKS
ncbi:MAG: cell division protein ZapA [Nitrospiraceae bacterium]|nr:cell division protein ZapA [Nitrospiraceae bacterium]